MSKLGNVYFIILLFSICLQSQVDTLEVSSNWQFKQVQQSETLEKGSDWKKAIVPGTVQEDLMRIGKIPNPHIGTNEDSIQWIENENWIYKTSFNLSEKELQREFFELLFLGLDTYSSIRFNGTDLLETANMFRSYKVDVSDLIREQNELEITFHSPIGRGKKFLDKLNYKLPAGNDAGEIKVSPVVRKAGYHFGWDWGPRIVTSGIWRPIYLLAYDDNKIENIHLQQTKLNVQTAEVVANINLKKIPKNTSCKIYIDDKELHFEQLNQRENNVQFTIKNPKFWFPNGLGEQNLYKVKVEVYQDEKLLDSWLEKIGLRTVELVNKPDDIGTSFYFKINGKPVFAKGANYIPQSHFINSKTEDDYRKLLEAAKNANMNMIRVWGGGIYENDVFYDICDELGLMVWQDFMFANTVYPPDKFFLNEIKEEAIDNIVRLRNHPSIVHWNGNNEINVAWFNWGWQKQHKYTSQDSTDLYDNYKFIFQDLIPNILDSLDINATYTHTSPLSNWGKAENFNHSSMHYWGVYHGNDGFNDYAKNIGRFNSEYGFQSFPTYNSLKNILPKSSSKNDTVKVLEHRQKSYKRNDPIYKFISAHLPEPDNLEETSYLSQLSQARGIYYAIQNHRINQPHCMGTLYWQLNDCWPAISWSSIDHSGEWKALHYFVKKAYAESAIFVDTTQNKFDIVLIKEGLDKYKSLLLNVSDFNGNIIATHSLKPQKTDKSIQRFDVSNWIKSQNLTDCQDGFLSVRIVLESGKKLDHLHFFTDPKHLKLETPEIEVKTTNISNGLKITLKSNTLVKNLCLNTEINGLFEDNFFDLTPFQTKSVIFKSEDDLSSFENSLKLMSINDF